MMKVYNSLLLHTEIRWLSKGVSLNRFSNLSDSVRNILVNKDNELCGNLIASKNDVANLIDFLKIFNDVKQLQGDVLNLIKTKNAIAVLIGKLVLFKRNLERGEYNHFPTWSALSVKLEDSVTYCQHLDALHVDFTE